VAELYEHLNPMPFEAVVQVEVELAEELRPAGYTVTGGHSQQPNRYKVISIRIRLFCSEGINLPKSRATFSSLRKDESQLKSTFRTLSNK
jgi:hypothetical protein